MDLIEFWIWEHATKHGMAKVLKRMTSLFRHCDAPNSWLAAQLLRRIKEEWDLPEFAERISSQEICTLQECLTSIFNHHRKKLKASIKTIDLIKLDLGCKATFLVLRSEISELRVWKQARDAMFPNWNDQLWIQVKRTFALKNDILLEEYKNFFEEVKTKLQPRNCKQSILDLFSIQMKKCFPLLIAFLQRIKLSVLERMKIEEDRRRNPSCNLDPDIQFLPAFLAKGIHDEIQMLNIWEEVQRRKLKKRTQYDSMIIRAVKPSESSTIGVFHAVPSQPDNLAQSSLGFPSCFSVNPCIPTSYTRRNREGQLEEIEIDKSIPRDVNGIAVFNPFWFTDGSMTLKQERIEVELHDSREWNSVETRNHSEPPNKKQCRQRIVESELPEQENAGEPRELVSLACRTRYSNHISISIESPKNVGRHEAEDISEGRLIVTRLLAKLQEQSKLLNMRSNDANKHCKELNHCMSRVLHIHQEIGNEENDVISVVLQR